MQSIIANKRADLFIGFVLLLVGFLVRWFYVVNLDITVPFQGDPTLPFQGDETSYYYYAKNLWEHSVFSRDSSGAPVSDSYWAPGYPIFLLLCFKLASILHVGFYPCVLTLQSILGGLITGFSYWFGRSFLAVKPAFVACVLIIISPHLNSHGGYLLSETLFTFLIIISLYCFQKAVTSTESIYWIITGSVFGLGYLTNPVILFMPFLLAALALCIFNCKIKGRLLRGRHVSLFLAVFMLFVCAWGLRSLLNVPEGAQSSGQRAFENLVIGADKSFHDVWFANTAVSDASLKVISQADADIVKYKNDHSAFYRELASRIADQPGHYLHWYLIQKPLDLWGWNIRVGVGDIHVFRANSTIYQTSIIALISLVMMKQLHFWLLGLAIVGIFFVGRDNHSQSKQALLATYALLIYTSAVFVVLHADARYSVPMRPEMYLCAVFAIQRIYVLVKALNEKSQLPVSNE